MLITSLIIVGVLIILVMIVVGIYNKLVTLKNRFENAFSQIEVQLQRRYDLIPNLIETVKGYMLMKKKQLSRSSSQEIKHKVVYRQHPKILVMPVQLRV